MDSTPQVIRLLFGMHKVFLSVQASIHDRASTTHFDPIQASQDYLSVFDELIKAMKVSNLDMAHDLLFLRSIWALLEMFYLRIYKHATLARTTATEGILSVLRDFIKALADLDGTALQRQPHSAPETRLKLDLLLGNIEDIQGYLASNHNPLSIQIANLLNGISQPKQAKLGADKLVQASGKKSELQQIIDLLSGNIQPLEFLGHLTIAQIGDDQELRPLMRKLSYFVKQADTNNSSLIVPITSNALIYLCFLIIIEVQYGKIKQKRQDTYVEDLRMLFEILLKSAKLSHTYGPYVTAFLVTLQSVLSFSSIALLKQQNKEHTQEAFISITPQPMSWSFSALCGMNSLKKPLLLMVYAHVIDLISTADRVFQPTRVAAIMSYAECLSEVCVSADISGTQKTLSIDTASTGVWKLAIDYYRWTLPSNADLVSKNNISHRIQQVLYSKITSAEEVAETIELLHLVSRLELGPEIELLVKKGAAQMLERRNLIQDAALWYKRAGKMDELKRLVTRALKEAIRVAMEEVDGESAGSLFAAIEAMISDVDMADHEIVEDIALAKNIKLFREHIIAARQSIDKRRQHAKEIQALAYELVSSPSFFLNVVPAVVSDACSDEMGTHINAAQFEELSLGFQRSLTYYNAEAYLPQSQLGLRNIAATQYEICSRLAEIYMMSTEKLS
ncbi:Hypothetical protein GLP15_294 [Giardia lamblia P15]|uniref:Uncharacterized protein n=1 Tax=Giardia intestinalis (strain P15) TaxID=658858 RepID=E1F3M8_GIAIA|nr:Hypothetical protein GLP15_294 [Giardia lamblia P15]